MKKLIEIEKIIQWFGFVINKDKLKVLVDLKNVEYLGICLNKFEHIMKNVMEFEKSINDLSFLYENKMLSNGVKIRLFRTISLSK